MVTKCVISQDQDSYHESHEETQVNLSMYLRHRPKGAGCRPDSVAHSKESLMKSFHGRLECVRLSGDSKFRESLIIAIIGGVRVVT